MLRTTLLLLLAACWSSKPAPATTTGTSPAPEASRPAPAPASPPTEFEAAIAKFREFRDMMCACADRACADKVNEVMAEWGRSMSKKSKEPTLTEAEKEAFMEVARDLALCSQKAYGPPAGTP
jgi:hypothetical protein